MGIAKTINALGEYNFYSADYSSFCQKVSRLFGVNLTVYHWSCIEDDTTYDKDEEYLDIGATETYKITICYHVDNDGLPQQPGNLYCDYELHIPVHFENEDELLLEFFANGIFQLNFIPFNNAWKQFIQDIIGENDHYYNSHREIVEEIIKIREVYIDILQKFDCKQVILWTYAYYKTLEKIEYRSSEPILTLQEIMSYMQEVDNMRFYNFYDALKGKVTIVSEINDRYVDIALIDNLGAIFLFDETGLLYRAKRST